MGGGGGWGHTTAQQVSFIWEYRVCGALLMLGDVFEVLPSISVYPIECDLLLFFNTY